MTEIHICAPASREEKITYQICTSNRYKCKGRPKRKMRMYFYEWYDPHTKCLTCDKVYHFEE